MKDLTIYYGYKIKCQCAKPSQCKSNDADRGKKWEMESGGKGGGEAVDPRNRVYYIVF